MYKDTLFNREEALRQLDEDEAIIRAMEIAELELKAKKREAEKRKNAGEDFTVEDFKFDKNLPIDLTTIMNQLQAMDPKLYEEAKRVNDIEGVVAFVKDNQGACVCLRVALGNVCVCVCLCVCVCVFVGAYVGRDMYVCVRVWLVVFILFCLILFCLILIFSHDITLDFRSYHISLPRFITSKSPLFALQRWALSR
jgi:hypothetical protein